MADTPQTPADMPTGFFQGADRGERGANYGWGLATCILKTPHDGVERQPVGVDPA